ncbi:hypothetical protein F3X89_13425 [Rhizobium rhizogenes]|uniref:hypothetical protein n=1 Tax=Rhizobium rhizogenes TaxID=359 RepID=UPI00193CEC6B|nr:hypothetical protein [Rhizobium rhizogenes]QRM38754.1 hypothetical protein F3X89_13425 [Rhizobium rhizogenes]
MTRATKARRAPATSDEFTIARAQVRKKNNLAMGLRMLRKSEDPAKLYRLAGRFARHPSYRGLTLAHPFPKNMLELSKNATFRTESFDIEFAWLASLVKAYAAEIQSFVGIRQELEMAFLSGNHQRIDELHRQAETAFGHSVWLWESRILYLDLPGVTGNRVHYTQSIRDADAPPLFNFLVSWVSYRTSAGVSAGEVDRWLGQVLKEAAGLAGIAFPLNGRYPDVDLEAAADMLSYSDALPLVDRYQVMILALQSLFASQAASVMGDEAIKAVLADLCKYIDDPQLFRLARALGIDLAVFVDQRLLALLDDFNGGYFSKVIDDITASDGPKDIETLELLLRSKMLLEQTEEPSTSEGETRTLFREIETDLAAVLSYGDDGVEARLRLQKVILSHCNSSWAASLRLILERQTHDNRVFEPNRIQTVLGLRSAIDQPNLLLSLPAGEVRDELTSRISADHSTSVTIAILSGLCSDAEGQFPESLSGMDQAIAVLRRGEISNAIERLKDLTAPTEPTIVQLESFRLLAAAYWRDGQIAETADLTARLFVQSRYFGSVLPIRDLVNEFLKRHSEPLPGSATRGRLSVAIVFDIFSRNISSEHDAERADAYKDVLKANGVRKASELGQHAEHFPVNELVYFLRFVCVPDVLDQSLALDTSRAVEDERVAILLLISELIAGKTPAAIKDELREIRTRQVVRETTLRLDESKIYVNIEGIKRAIDVSMRDDWNRYRLMNDGLETALFEIIEKVRSEKADPVRIIFANPSERFAILRRIITVLRDEFTMNKEFGLNSNLSTNIRHGYVEREIRAPLLARNLVTNTDKGFYLPNKFWLERLDSGDTDEEACLSALFDKFSTRIDDEIDRVNRKLLRVHSEESPEGLFKYGISDAAIVAADATWSSKETFDEFIDAVFSTFWEGTQRNLVMVRAALTSQVLAEFIESLNALALDLAEEGFDQRLPDLEHAITMVQTETRAAVERVASWFTLSSNNEYQDFDLAIAFQAGMNTVKTYFRNLSIQEDYASNGEIIMNGWCLPMFARLFFLILDNAATHGARNRSNLKISMFVEVRENHLFIKATNDLPVDYNSAELIERAAEINRDYGQARAMELLSEEGGSGYPKIWKLLKTDLRKNHDLFVSVSENEFGVEILLPTAGIVNETIDSRG